MKRRREGTLTWTTYETPAEMQAFFRALSRENLPRLLDDAERLAQEMENAGPGTLRGKEGASLRHSTARIREDLAAGADAALISRATSFALEYARLLAELRDDESRPTYRSITRKRYFEACAKHKKVKDQAEYLGVSVQAVWKWKRINL